MLIIKINILLAITLTLLKVGDWRATRAALLSGGSELIPLTRWLIARLGMDPGLIAEVFLYAGIGAFFAWSGATSTWPYAPWLCLNTLLALNGVLAWVVWHNLKQIRQ